MGRHLTYEERFYIEKELKKGTSPTLIAETLGKHFTTIYKEIGKGTVTFLNYDYSTRKAYSTSLLATSPYGPAFQDL